MSDIELETLKKKKLKEIERKLKEASNVQHTHREEPLDVVKRLLVGRGLEVLNAAKAQYPEVTDIVVRQLAVLIKSGRFNQPLTGELLFALYRTLGVPVRLETRIVFEEHGEVKTLAEKLKESR